MVLSNASVTSFDEMLTSLHEHSAHVKVVWARSPAQSIIPMPVLTTMGGPPFTHFGGGGPSIAAGAHMPPTQPIPCAHFVPQEPQWSLSVARSTHALAQMVSPGRQLDSHLPPEQARLPLHTMPQPPQFFGSLTTWMQTPLHIAW